MNALPKNPLTSALGIATGVAGALLLAAISLADNPLGHTIGALIATSVAAGVIGACLRESRFPARSIRRGPRPGFEPSSDPVGPGAIAILSPADATACTFDRTEERAPDFASVVSLTEIAVERRREKREQREIAVA